MLPNFIFDVLLFVILLSAIYFFIRYRVTKRILDERNAISRAVWKIDRIILNTLDFNKTIENIVNAALLELSKYGYAILVLSLVDESKGVLRRISISRTEEAGRALQFSPIPFNSIEIALTAKDNINIQVINKNQEIRTSRLSDLLIPVIDPKLADEAQKAAGIHESIVFPVTGNGKVVGTLIFSTKKQSNEIAKYEEEIMSGFVDAVGIALENSILFQNLKNVTNQLEFANERLKELDRLKDDFVSVASHELRTPMTAIKSYLYMAINKGDIKLSAKMVRYLTRAYLSTERLINLVNDMLNVSRIEAGRVEIIPKVIDISLLMEDIVSEIMPKADERGVTVTTVKSQIPRVFADPDKVYQVVLNLLGNALKFTPPGGTISISFFSDGKTVETSVKDTGVGISQSDISQLFQKFSRLDNSYVAAATSGGTGLGLFISKSLVEMMHGRIGVYSKGVNMGSTFTFSLPVATSGVVKNAADFTVRVEGEVKRLEPIAI